MTTELRPGLFLETSGMGYRLTWACRSQAPPHRKTTHTAQEVFATNDGLVRALDMVRKTPPACPHGCEPAI